MRILVDMDDTIEQLLKAWVSWVNARHGRSVALYDITDWDVTKAYPGLTQEEVYGVMCDEAFWLTVEPMPGAVEGVKYLIDRGHEVYIVTSSKCDEIAGKMKNHLFRCFPYISWDQVVVTSRKQLLKADVLIDDGPHNLEGGDFIKILMDAPHNRKYDERAHGMTRVYSWEEIIKLIDALDK